MIDSQEIAGIASYNYNDDLGLYKHNPVVYVKDGIEVPDDSVLKSKGTSRLTSPTWKAIKSILNKTRRRRSVFPF